MSASLLGAAMKAKLGSRTRKLVLIKLVDCCHEDGTHIYPALATVAEDAECSLSTARRTLKEFCAVGLLRKVKDGGSGAKSTNHFEMDVEMLMRLRRPEYWPALEAAALHDPLPDSEDDDAPRHAPDAGRGASPAPSCENKGVTVEGFHGDSLPNRKGRVSSDDTQPLREPLEDSERESASAISGFETGPSGTDARPAAEAELPATLAEFRKLWPTTSVDHNGLVEGAWAALPFGQHRAAIAGIPAYLAELKRFGRGKTPSGSTYLSQRKWNDVPALAAVRTAASPVAVPAWSRDWWVVVLGRIMAGAKVSFVVDQAAGNKGLTAASGEIEAARGRIGEVSAYLCDGPEIEAWRPWLAQRGARIPTFKGDFRVFLPSERPPGSADDDGDAEVRF